MPKRGPAVHLPGESDGSSRFSSITAIPNGIYDVILRVRGGADETNAVVRVSLDTQLKVGQFSFSEQALVIPANGIPLTVNSHLQLLQPGAGRLQVQMNRRDQ